MSEWPCVDEEFTRLKDSLEKGDIVPSDVARLGEIIYARFQNNNVPNVFDQCSNVFAEFYHNQVEQRFDEAANTRIQRAALALIDALNESKKPEHFTVTDKSLWRMAVGERECIARLRRRKSAAGCYWPTGCSSSRRILRRLTARGLGIMPVFPGA